MSSDLVQQRHSPWNKGRLIGQKRPLKPREVWTIRIRLQLEARKRDLAMFNLAIDSKLRGCDLVRLKVDDICFGGKVAEANTRRVPYLSAIHPLIGMKTARLRV